MTGPTTKRRAGVDRTDLVTGILSMALGIAVIPYAVTMPRIREGMPGPGLFPGIIGAFLVLFGAVLLLKMVLRMRRGDEAVGSADVASSDEPVPDPAARDGDDTHPASGAAGADVAQPGLATTTAGRWLNGLVILGAIVFYIVAAETVGFLIAMFVILAAIMLVLRTRPLTALLVAGALTGLLYLVFEQLLLVQLPDGLLG